MSARWGIQPDPPRCRCTHTQDVHGLDRKRRPTCFGSTVCGCSQFREPDDRDAAMQRHPSGKDIQ